MAVLEEHFEIGDVANWLAGERRIESLRPNCDRFYRHEDVTVRRHFFRVASDSLDVVGTVKS